MSAKPSILLFVLIFTLAVLSGCLDDVRYNMPCQRPEHVDESEIIGIWQAHYRHYTNTDFRSPLPMSPMSGTETLIIHANGTYRQHFQSPEYNYIGTANQWSLVLDEGDGPKLQMEGLRYFANGLDYVDGPLNLSLQLPDWEAYVDSVPLIADRKAKIVIDYPEEGFVYLYPRSCLGKFVLLQMISGWVDPDNRTVHNPVFTKVE